MKGVMNKTKLLLESLHKANRLINENLQSTVNRIANEVFSNKYNFHTQKSRDGKSVEVAFNHNTPGRQITEFISLLTKANLNAVYDGDKKELIITKSI